MIEIDNLTKIYKLSKKQMQKEKTKETVKVAVKNVSLKAAMERFTAFWARMEPERLQHCAVWRHFLILRKDV